MCQVQNATTTPSRSVKAWAELQSTFDFEGLALYSALGLAIVVGLVQLLAAFQLLPSWRSSSLVQEAEAAVVQHKYLTVEDAQHEDDDSYGSAVDTAGIFTAFVDEDVELEWSKHHFRVGYKLVMAREFFGRSTTLPPHRLKLTHRCVSQPNPLRRRLVFPPPSLRSPRDDVHPHRGGSTRSDQDH